MGIMSRSIGLMWLKGALKSFLFCVLTADNRHCILHVKGAWVDSNLRAAHEILITHLCVLESMRGCLCVARDSERKSGSGSETPTAPSSFSSLNSLLLLQMQRLELCRCS